jgi:hypothetical protein
LESKRKYKQKLEDLERKIAIARETKQRRELEKLKRDEMRDQWESERKELQRWEELWYLHSDL